MIPVSVISEENATLKSIKIHRSLFDISRKIITFNVIENLLQTKMSARGISRFLEVPNSSMRSWLIEGNERTEHAVFFSTPDGAKLLENIVSAVVFVIEYGPSGARGVQEFLQLSGLDKLVASSNGALHAYSKRIEQHIVSFGVDQEKLLATKMRARKVTVGLDEMFRGRSPCLVAIEVVSNFILFEKFTENRKAETWKQEIDTRLDGLPIEVGQVVSDLCGALTSYTKDIDAQHSPDLFHGQQELTKATAAPLASQERAFEKAVNDANAKVTKAINKHGQMSKEADLAIMEQKLRAFGLEERSNRIKKVREAKKTLGSIYHPINLRNGEIQTADSVNNQINTELQTIKDVAMEAGLSQGCMDRIAKAGRAFDGMVDFLKGFLLVFMLYVDGLQLLEDQKCFFVKTAFPLAYLRMILKRQNKEERERLKIQISILEKQFSEGPWSKEQKDDWMKKAQERAEYFQRHPLA